MLEQFQFDIREYFNAKIRNYYFNNGEIKIDNIASKSKENSQKPGKL